VFIYNVHASLNAFVLKLVSGQKGKKNTKTCTHGQCFEKFCFANLIKEVLSFLTSFGFV
jgi:hypothetical protein